MKKLLLLISLCFATFAVADEITFSFIGTTAAIDVVASPSGMSAGPAVNVLVTDSTSGKSFTLAGTFNADTGAATSLTVTPTNYSAVFGAGPTGSVSISGAVTGDMLANSDLNAALNGGTGSFSGIFHVSFVNPAVLALFGLGPEFSPSGSVGITFGQDELLGSDVLTAVIGGGTTTIVVQTPIPEPATGFMGLLGVGMLAAYYQARKHSKV